VRLIDLSLVLSDGVSTYPGGPKMNVMNRITHEWTHGRYLPPAISAADRVMMLNEHIGTHVDAPFHFVKAGATIEQLDLDLFCGTAVLADVSDRRPLGPVTVEHVSAALARRNESLHPGDILLIRTWPGARTDPEFLRAPALDRSVGEWAVARHAKSVGIDLANVVHPGDRSFPVHMALLPAGVLIYENIANLESVPAARFQFFGLPIRLAGATGSPVRAVAVLEGDREPRRSRRGRAAHPVEPPHHHHG
jgi:kynurenine formamidase